MSHTLPPDADWVALRAQLPADLDTTAFQYGALLRKRDDGIASADALLRCVLAYTCEHSLRATAAWAAEAGVATVSDVALLERFRHCGAWLGHLVSQLLPVTPPAGPSRRVRLLDATMLCAPGSRQTDWRVHLSLDLATQRIAHVRVTPDTEGETVAGVPLAPGEVVLVDRGYATRTTLRAVTAQAADLLVRLPWSPNRVRHRDGRPLELMATVRTVAPGQIAAWEVQWPLGTGPAVPGRLIVAALPEPQATQARTRRQHRARRHRDHAIRDPRTLEASGYLLLFTTVPAEALSPEQAVTLYRLRWQVELTFKRLKSVLHLDALPSKEPRLARTWILAKLLIALLLDRLVLAAEAFPPSGLPADESMASAAMALPYRGPCHPRSRVYAGALATGRGGAE